MIRVLHVIDHLGVGGAQAVLLDLARNFDARRVSCEVAVMHGWGPFADALTAHGIRVHSLAKSKWSPVHVRNLLSILHQSDFHALHFHLNGSNWIAKPMAALACGIPCIAHDHASADPQFRGLHSLLPDAVAHRFSNHVVAVSESVRRFLIDYEALSRDDITLIPNGVDTSMFRPATVPERSRARSSLGLADGAFVVGAMGRLAPEKNFELLPEIAELLPKALFVVGGEGPSRGEIERSILRRGVAERVKLAGGVVDRAGFYHALDAFVLVSKFEGLPMVLLEAMAAGVPVVASHLPDVAEALGAGRFGRLADPRSAASFTGPLRHLALSPEARHEAAESGRARCLEAFSAASSARQIEALYSRVCRGGLSG